MLILTGSTTQAGGTENIEALEALIGSWRCSTKSATFKSQFRWILDHTFIEHDQEVRLFGKTHRVKEVIGWDPTSKTIKGWIFSQDWIATSTYTRSKQGHDWIVEVVLTRKNGDTNRKRKTLSVVGDEMIVRTEKAPLDEFLALEFRRDQPADVDSRARE